MATGVGWPYLFGHANPGVQRVFGSGGADIGDWSAPRGRVFAEERRAIPQVFPQLGTMRRQRPVFSRAPHL
jgi:hypothetical protein